MMPDYSAVIVLIAALGGGVSLFLLLRAVTGRRSPEFHRRLERVGNSGGGGSEAQTANLRRTNPVSRVPGLERLARHFLPRPALLRRRLARTGRRISLGGYLFATLIAALAAFLLLEGFAGIKPLLAMLFSIAAGFAVPHLAVNFMIARRLGAFTDQFPDAIDLIVRGLQSGLPVSESIRAVGDEFLDPVGREFRYIADKMKLGASLDDALWDAADRLATAEFRFFVISLSVQRETGGNLAETLGNLSDILRRRRQMQLKIRAMASEGKASAMILGSLPFVMFVIMFMVNREYVMTLFFDPMGHMLIGGGLVSLTIGVGAMAKMVRFEI